MKRAIWLTLVGVLVLGTTGMTASVSGTLYPGANLIAAPLVPFDPTPSTVFNNGGIYIDLQLMRWDAVGQGYVAFDQWGDPTVFGNILLGEGYVLNQDAQVTWTYDGVPDGVPDTAGTMTDMWISLPKAGVTLFGHPFNHNVTFSNCLMTDGTTTKTMEEARTAGWTDGIALGWDAQGQGYYAVEIDFWGTYLDLTPFSGYWITTNVDNLALIIPAN